jgi:tRNA1Val (adenine37-N6)-methyltransferase
MTPPFRFQQFMVYQSQAAFKVGTDSVLLGSWIAPDPPKNVLDLGAGTGILSLMMAQRFNPHEITAIELDENAVKDCANNFAQSKWKDNLLVVHTDLFLWSKENKTKKFF